MERGPGRRGATLNLKVPFAGNEHFYGHHRIAVSGTSYSMPRKNFRLSKWALLNVVFGEIVPSNAEQRGTLDGFGWRLELCESDPRLCRYAKGPLFDRDREPYYLRVDRRTRSQRR